MSMNKNTNTEASGKDVWLYSTGNFANNIIFMMVSLYVMYYYTNILGISALAAGTIFMVARLVDAVTDPIMGAIVDRTNTKMGKYRPFYYLWRSVFRCCICNAVYHTGFRTNRKADLRLRILYFLFLNLDLRADSSAGSADYAV